MYRIDSSHNPELVKLHGLIERKEVELLELKRKSEKSLIVAQA